MKKFLFIPSVLLFTLTVLGQERAAVPATYKCKATCLFTSCEIECSASASSGASCNCWFGLAQCHCISVQQFKVTQTADQRSNLVLFISDIRSVASTEGLAVYAAITRIRDLFSEPLTAEKQSEYQQYAKAYNDNAGKLAGSDKQVIEAALERAKQRVVAN